MSFPGKSLVPTLLLPLLSQAAVPILVTAAALSLETVLA
jgi:hypothetical protein